MRKPSVKPGQLVAWYGPHEGYPSQLCAAWGGEGATKRDGGVLMYALSGERHRRSITEEEKAQGPIVYEPSLIEDLRARGYDLSTLRFSIRKLPAAPRAASESEIKDKT